MSLEYIVLIFLVDGDPVNTKHLYTICTMLDQRRRRWSSIVQMVYKCFVFTVDTLNHEENQKKINATYLCDNSLLFDHHVPRM